MPMTTKTTLARVARGLARTLFVLCAFSGAAHANAFTKIFSDDEPKYVTAPPAPKSQSDEDVLAKTAGCQSCHAKTESKTMHMNPAVQLGCTDCHGGNATVSVTAGVERDVDLRDGEAADHSRHGRGVEAGLPSDGLPELADEGERPRRPLQGGRVAAGPERVQKPYVEPGEHGGAGYVGMPP